MLRVALAVLLLNLLTLPASAQSPWTGGFELLLGATGDHVREVNSYADPGSSYGAYEKRNFWSPALGMGSWLHYQLGKRWGIQLGLQYQRLEYNLREDLQDYTPTGALRYASREHQQIIQHAVALPLEVRYFFSLPHRRLRPFIGAQLALAYYAAGTLLFNYRWDSPVSSTTRVAELSALDPAPVYLDSSPWQGLFGGQIGLAFDPFTVSIWHQRNLRNRYDYHACRCYAAALAHTNYHRIFLHTQLRIAYRW